MEIQCISSHLGLVYVYKMCAMRLELLYFYSHVTSLPCSPVLQNENIYTFYIYDCILLKCEVSD